MSGIPEQDLDERTAEALLTGSLAPHEAPPGWERVAALLRAAGREVPGIEVGTAVVPVYGRHPVNLAMQAATAQLAAGGRFSLGIGSGWFERDYDEYGYEFGTARGRLADLERDLPIIKDRLGKLTPGPVGPLPIMVGGSGRKVTLRIVAEQATSWNSFGPPERWAELNAVLDDWCGKVGRDPAEIERTVAIDAGEAHRVPEYAEVGADHVIVMQGPPFTMDALQTALDARG